MGAMSGTGMAWLGVACGVATGIGGVAALDAADRADAQASKVEVTAEQLLINQRISQAAVRRGNRALNYLAPIRTTATDGADDGRSGVVPLATVAGSGAGWTGAQIADSAIARSKVANDAVSSEKLSPEVRAQLGATVQSTDASTPGAFLGEPIPSGGTSQLVLSTADNTGAKVGRGPLTFDVPRRIVANGFVDVREAGGAPSIAVCFLGARQGGGTSFMTTPQGGVTVPAGNTVRIPLSGTIDLAPGTYDVVIYCRGGATATIEEMTVNATVADQ
jgi:hypothetical protein